MINPLLSTNVRMALQSLGSSKGRSLFTMFGIIIGVASVVTMVSLGEGFKQQIIGQSNRLGNDLITIRPGNLVTRDKKGKVNGLEYNNALTSLGASSLTELDLGSVSKIPNVASAVPLSILAGTVKVAEKTLENSIIIGTTPDFPNTLNQKVQFGAFFTPDDNQKNVAVIGIRVAESLYGEDAPLGKTIKVRDKEFIIRAVMEEILNAPLSGAIDFNNAVLIPFPVAKALSGSSAQIAEIIIKPESPDRVQAVVDTSNKLVTINHGGQTDFTTLKADESVFVASSVINIMTVMIAAVAAISLIVGGIGVMNIMLFSVSERTREIGVRKSIGASSRQIMAQFLIESIVLCVVGGIIALIIAGATNVAVRVLTSYKPFISPTLAGLSLTVCLLLGLVFGLIPAYRASKKDPIEALRGH